MHTLPFITGRRTPAAGWWIALAVCALLWGIAPAQAQTDEQDEPPQSNVAIILDASGSMQALIGGGQSRIAAAREAVIRFSSEIPPTTNASLWVYGHRLSQDDPAASCQDIEAVIPLQPVDPEAFAETVAPLQAIGYTPLADSLRLAAQSLPPGADNVIVLVSDGEESCGGDPCAVARELVASDVELQINTIGYAADAATRAQLECIAQAGGGAYYEARETPAELLETLRQASRVPTGTIAVVGDDGQVLEDVAFDVFDAETDASAGAAAGSGTFAPGEYRVRVFVERPFEVFVAVQPDETTAIRLPGTGTVRVVDNDGQPLADTPLQVFALDGQTSVASSETGSIELRAGRYVVRAGTQPPIERTVTVREGQTTDITFGTGFVQMVDLQGRPTDEYPIFIFAADGQTSVANAETGSAELAPGTYVVRTNTRPPFEFQVTVAAGETVEIPFGPGTVQLVDSDGQPSDAYTLFVFEPDGQTSVTNGEGGRVELFPGTYLVRVGSPPVVEQTVTVEGGAVVEIALP